MTDETEFQKAYKDHRDEKHEARRLQGLLARMLAARPEAEAQIEGQVGIANAAYAETVRQAAEKLNADLALTGGSLRRVHQEIAETEASLEGIRKRGAKRTESLFSLLNDDLRQQ